MHEVINTRRRTGVLVSMARLMERGALDSIVDTTAQFLPDLFVATVIRVIGYIAGRIVYAVINRVLEDTNVDDYFAEQGHLELELSNLFAELAKWLVFFASLFLAADVLGVEALTELLQDLVAWIPDVIAAVAIFLAGYGIAVYTKDNVVGTETLYADLLGKLIFFSVLLIALSTALEQAGVSATLMNNIILLLVASIGLAFAIAFGWGLKDVVREEAQRYMDEQD